MKNLFLFVVILFLIVFIGGCNSTESEDDLLDFESGFYYKHSAAGQIDLFRSKSIVAVEFSSNISAEEAKNIIQAYRLEPIKMFEHTPYGNNWDDLINEDLVLMRLPIGAKLEDYLTHIQGSQIKNSEIFRQ